MQEASMQETPDDRERIVADRDPVLTATVRSKAYGTYSALLASPHEIDVQAKLQDDGVHHVQPYGIDMNALVTAYEDSDLITRQREYSGLFEVGDRGPAISIREQQQFSHVAGIREELLRYYEFFDYPLHQHQAWAPDHISVILEFYHLLCYRESVTGEDRLSCQLAQLDFAERHLVSWAPLFADRVDVAASSSMYSTIARSFCDFVKRDYEWQESTVVVSDRSGADE